MAWLLLCLLAVVSARYAEYGNAKMPQYGDAFDEVAKDHEEYTDKTPDAPSLLDYKLDEEIPGKNDRYNNDREDSNSWTPQPPKKFKRPTHSILDRKLESDRYIVDEPSNFKANGNNNLNLRFIKKDYDISDDVRLNRNKFHRQRNERFNNRKDEDLTGDFQDRHENHFEDTTAKFIRRKPRDRHTSESNDDEFQDKYTRSKYNQRFSKSRSDSGSDYKTMARERVDSEYRHTDEDDRDDAPVARTTKRKFTKDYDEYSDYYDMKRVLNIKDKLPSLLRRNKASVSDGNTPAAIPDKRTTLLLERHLASQGSIAENSPTTTAVASVISRQSTTQTPNIQIPSTELSMAEKSRLSILRKSQKKDNSKDKLVSRKPAVLLQVTPRNLNTVVIVEPRINPVDPNLKALSISREVSNDTPETLQKVKKMMRHKLVKNAKNINELIDNWDEMVCDYVDVALLDSNNSSFSTLNYWLYFSLVFVCIYIL